MDVGWFCFPWFGSPWFGEVESNYLFSFPKDFLDVDNDENMAQDQGFDFGCPKDMLDGDHATQITLINASDFLYEEMFEEFEV